ncbi:peptide-N-glycosidase F-like protein [Flavobacterium sp. 103]|uniref:peptide-N-glycosidase F-related protein n=1 Tax=Flavobacterium sp. 103 TaxID=2135624 RepID=UPI000D5DAE3B|nr:peptide-N-glycosidase F-related protein [Flavobacterium sp. 103]PVX44484.1 peptide-N-glycosidase F-like protein [Flavobacterium sp. 103]
MKKIIFTMLLGTLFFNNCVTAQKIEIFDEVRVNHDENRKDFSTDNNENIYYGGGQYVFKKVTFPKQKLNTKVEISVTVISGGDRYDRAGSIYVLPVDKNNSLEDVVKNKKFASNEYTKIKTIVPEGNFSPTIELMRFMTTFGIGFFSNDSLQRKPVYIPYWEREVKWKEDISQFSTLLQGEVWIGVHIGNYTKGGHIVSASINLTPSELSCDIAKNKVIVSILNTDPFGTNQGNDELFAYKDFQVEFNLPKGAKNAKLYYITTGHGGHSEGDEFVKKQNIVKIDDKKVIDFIPWRDDCASFRRFNPGTGVWLRKRVAPYIQEDKGTYTTKEIEEPIASSDLSRSNWCPGSNVPAMVVPLDLKEGKHTAVFSIPEAQKNANGTSNHWMVSSYIVYEL